MEDKQYLQEEVLDERVKVKVIAQENFQTIELEFDSTITEYANTAYSHLVTLRNVIKAATEDVKQTSKTRPGNAPSPNNAPKPNAAANAPEGSTTERQRVVLRKYGFTEEQMDGMTIAQASAAIMQYRGF